MMMMMTIPFLFSFFPLSHIFIYLLCYTFLNKKEEEKKKLINPLPHFFGGLSHS